MDTVTLYVIGATEFVGGQKAANSPQDLVGMYWTTLPDFPKPTNMLLYLSSSGSLQLNPEPNQKKLSYTYDPTNPVSMSIHNIAHSRRFQQLGATTYSSLVDL